MLSLPTHVCMHVSILHACINGKIIFKPTFVLPFYDVGWGRDNICRVIWCIVRLQKVTQTWKHFDFLKRSAQ